LQHGYIFLMTRYLDIGNYTYYYFKQRANKYTRLENTPAVKGLRLIFIPWQANGREKKNVDDVKTVCVRDKNLNGLIRWKAVKNTK